MLAWRLIQDCVRELANQNAAALPVESREIQIGEARIRYSKTNAREKIHSVLLSFWRLGLLQNKTSVRIKISGDGYKNTSRTGYVVLGFAVLEGARVHDRNHIWTLHIGTHAEATVDLKAISEELSSELEEVLRTGVNLRTGHESFHLDAELFLSADQKFLCAVLGLGGPSKTFFCPWCEATKKERHSFRPSTRRTMTRISELAKLVADMRKHKSKEALDRWISGESETLPINNS